MFGTMRTGDMITNSGNALRGVDQRVFGEVLRRCRGGSNCRRRFAGRRANSLRAIGANGSTDHDVELWIRFRHLEMRHQIAVEVV